MKFNLNILIYTVLLIGILYSWTKCSSAYNKSEKLSEQIHGLSSDFSAFKVDVKRNAAIQDALVVNKNSKIAEQADSLKYLKRLKSKVKVVTKFITVRDTISKVDTVIQTPLGSYAKLPINIRESHKWYNYHFIVDEKGLIIRDSLEIRDQLTITVADQRMGWFKKARPVVVVENKNPFVQIDKMQNVIIDRQKRDLAIGFQVGYGISSGGISPYVGVGLQWNVIRLR